MLFTENLMNGGSLKRDGIAAFKIQYYSSANSPTVSLLTQSLEWWWWDKATQDALTKYSMK